MLDFLFGEKVVKTTTIKEKTIQSSKRMYSEDSSPQIDFIEGAKWQAERMYSEEDMIEFAKWVFLEVGSNTGKDRTNEELFDEWLNIKKK